jgi:DNA-binding NarL/FixJ family response regulator
VIPIRVLIADDQATFRRVIRAVFDSEPDMEIVAEAADGEEAVALVTAHAPHVVVMDIRMPKLSGVEAARVLNEIHPTTAILMLSVSDEQHDLFGAIQAGASGYLLKDTDPGDVVEAVRQVSRGEAVLSPAIAARVIAELVSLVDEGDADASAPSLTSREVQVLQHLASGDPASIVGQRLSTSENTVNRHVHNVLKKLHVHQHIQAAVDAVREQGTE